MAKCRIFIRYRLFEITNIRETNMYGNIMEVLLKHITFANVLVPVFKNRVFSPSRERQPALTDCKMLLFYCGAYREPFQNAIRYLIIRSHEVCQSRDTGRNHRSALKIDGHFNNIAAGTPVKFQSDQTVLDINFWNRCSLRYNDSTSYWALERFCWALWAISLILFVVFCADDDTTILRITRNW